MTRFKKIAVVVFNGLLAMMAAVAGSAAPARAEDYPSRPVRWIVGYPPGGASDIAARAMGLWLSERLGQPFVIENRPGASGNIATELVTRAPPDGYTLLLANAGNTINEGLFDKLNFVFARDIEPVALIVRVPLVMLVSARSPHNSVSEFVAYARSNPEKINMASAGKATPQHVAGELFRITAAVKMTHVAYRGSAPALSDLIGGHVQVAFDTTLASLGYISDGQLKALAVTTSTRLGVLPNVPTVSESLPGYEAMGWYGVGAPTRTPAAIVAKLNKEINAGLADVKLRTRLEELGGNVSPGTPAEFRRLIEEDTEKWAKLARAAGISVEKP